jgi:hypothetical protein
MNGFGEIQGILSQQNEVSMGETGMQSRQSYLLSRELLLPGTVE